MVSAGKVYKFYCDFMHVEYLLVHVMCTCWCTCKCKCDKVHSCMDTCTCMCCSAHSCGCVANGGDTMAAF